MFLFVQFLNVTILRIEVSEPTVPFIDCVVIPLTIWLLKLWRVRCLKFSKALSFIGSGLFSITMECTAVIVLTCNLYAVIVHIESTDTVIIY